MNTKETQLVQNLTQLRTKLLVMCAAVAIALEDACDALFTGNVGKAGAVVDGDAAVNALENEIDEIALSILVRHQPVAQDLRFVVAALRMVIDLERIGDEAASIAERAIILHDLLPEPVTSAVVELADTAKALYGQAVEAFRAVDADASLDLCRSDAESTKMEVKALRAIMEDFYASGKAARNDEAYAGMHGILVCRSLNRICRRSANIAEHTYFIAKGVNIKHVPVAPEGKQPK